MLGRGSRRVAQAPPFDVPCDDDFVGVCADGGTLLTVLDVGPGPARPSRVGSSWSRSTDGLPLECLAQWMIRPEAAGTTITVLSHGASCWGDGPAARAYRSLLGPLTVAAHRSVYVVIGFEPLRCRQAVARHGSGTAAALTACVSATRRIQSLLQAGGLSVAPLRASAITDVRGRLTEGVDPYDATADAGGLRSGRLHSSTFAVAAQAAPAVVDVLASAWRPEVLSATWALTLHPAGDSPQVSALVRSTQLSSAAPAANEHWTALPGMQRAACAATSAHAAPDGFRPPRLTSEAAQQLLQTTAPVSGAGQIVGADEAGVPVAMRLAGRGVPRSSIVGDHTLAAQTVGRLVALGNTVAIRSSRPERWSSLIDAVGDARLLTFHGRTPTQVVVDDQSGEPPITDFPGTVLTVRDLTVHATVDDDGTPLLRQDPADRDHAWASADGTTVRVSLVAAPAEAALTSATV